MCANSEIDGLDRDSFEVVNVPAMRKSNILRILQVGHPGVCVCVARLCPAQLTLHS